MTGANRAEEAYLRSRKRSRHDYSATATLETAVRPVFAPEIGPAESRIDPRSNFPERVQWQFVLLDLAGAQVGGVHDHFVG
jgi:hypothetical protein